MSTSSSEEPDNTEIVGRFVVAKEGVRIYNWLIEKEALVTDGKGLPVYLSFSYTVSIGYAYEMQRNEETGEVSFEMRLNGTKLGIKPDNTGLKIEDYDFTFSANNVSATTERDDEDNEYSRVISATIRAISAAPKLFYPKVNS